MAPSPEITSPAPEGVPTPPAPAPASGTRLRLALFSALSLCLGVAATVCLDRVQMERLSATYEGGPMNLSATRPGRIAAFLAAQGSRVKTDDLVVKLVDEGLEARLAALDARVRTLESELSTAQARAAAESQLTRHRLERELLETKLRSAEFLQNRFASQLEKTAWDELGQAERPALAIRSLSDADWIGALRAEGSPEELRIRALLRRGTAANAEEVAASKLALCEERIAQLEKALAAVPEQAQASPDVLSATTRLETARAELGSLQAQSNELMLAAGQPGVVGVFRRRVGDRVAAGETIVQIVDDSRRCVLVRIDSTRINDFAIGSTHDLLFANGQAGQGRVSEVQPQAEASGSRPQLVVRLEPAGASWPSMPFGSAVEVHRKR